MVPFQFRPRSAYTFRSPCQIRSESLFHGLPSDQSGPCVRLRHVLCLPCFIHHLSDEAGEFPVCHRVDDVSHILPVRAVPNRPSYDVNGSFRIAVFPAVPSVPCKHFPANSGLCIQQSSVISNSCTTFYVSHDCSLPSLYMVHHFFFPEMETRQVPSGFRSGFSHGLRHSPYDHLMASAIMSINVTMSASARLSIGTLYRVATMSANAIRSLSKPIMCFFLFCCVCLWSHFNISCYSVSYPNQTINITRGGHCPPLNRFLVVAVSQCGRHPITFRLSSRRKHFPQA